MLVNELLKDLESGVPDSTVLNSVFEIEDVLVVMKDVDRRVQHLKGLKKYRMDSINAEISKWQEREQQLRDLILRSVIQLEPDQKTFHFPDVAKISRRSSKGSWEVTDDSSLIDEFKNRGIADEAVLIKEVLDKRKAKKLLAELNDQKISGAEFKQGSDSISISFETNDKLTDKNQDAKQESKTAKMDSLDTLEV